MPKPIFFGATWCPYCQRAMAALKAHGIAYELVSMPRDHGERAGVTWKGKKFKDLFDGDLSIPKMLVGDDRFMGSDEIIAFAGGQDDDDDDY